MAPHVFWGSANASREASCRSFRTNGSRWGKTLRRTKRAAGRAGRGAPAMPWPVVLSQPLRGPRGTALKAGQDLVEQMVTGII